MNIDKLHDRPKTDRASGKTYDTVFELIGCLEVGEDGVITCAIVQYRDIHFISTMIRQVLEETHPEWTLEKDHYSNTVFDVKPLGKQITFIVPDEINIEGLRSGWVDFRDYGDENENKKLALYVC